MAIKNTDVVNYQDQFCCYKQYFPDANWAENDLEKLSKSVE